MNNYLNELTIDLQFEKYMDIYTKCGSLIIQLKSLYINNIIYFKYNEINRIKRIIIIMK